MTDGVTRKAPIQVNSVWLDVFRSLLGKIIDVLHPANSSVKF